jgi:DNA-directed RNA polymerase specialized sigma24 family protein
MAKSNEASLAAKVDTLIRLTALLLVRETGPTEAIKILGRSGMESSEIAEVVGTTPATVRATLSRARRARR